MKYVPAFFVASFLVTLSAYAQAQECNSDSDCPDGLVCEGEAATPCTTVACAPGEECPEPEPCDPEVYQYCVPAECTSDADCGDGLECVGIEYTSCNVYDVAACAEGEECPEPDPVEPECEERVESYCLPKYLAPCESASDCGEGFECIPAPESCACSGSSGSGDAGEEFVPDGDGDSDGDSPSADPLPPEEPDCTCEPSDYNICSPIEVECDADADCPEDWTCAEQEMREMPCGFNPETGEEDCPEPEPVQPVCMPPFFEIWSDADLGADFDEVLEDALESATGSDAQNTRLSDDGGESADDDEASSGCQAAPGNSGSNALWLLPLALFLFRRR